MDGYLSTGEAEHPWDATGRRPHPRKLFRVVSAEALSRGLTLANGAGQSGSELEWN